MRPSPQRRWRHWQQSLVAEAYLTPEAVRHGYTLLRVPPPCREVFFQCVSLFLAQGHIESMRATLLEHPDTVPLVVEAQEALEAWQRWTRRVTAYLTRLAEGQAGTMPPLPPEFVALQQVLDGGRHAVSTP